MDGTTRKPQRRRQRHKKEKNPQLPEQNGNISSNSGAISQNGPNSLPFVGIQANIAQLSRGIESIQLCPPTRRQLPPRAARPLFGSHLLGIQPIHTSTPVDQVAISTTPPKGPRNSNIQAPAQNTRSYHSNKKNKKPNSTKPRTDWRSPARDDRSPPSMASGGVPDPTPDYIAQSQGPITRLQSPQNLLVVIDLNGTLLFRPSKRNPTKFVTRPDAEVFLQRCLQNYTVVVWSSAKPENVHRMCQKLGEQHLQKAVAIWGRDTFGLSAQDYNLRVQCYKRLTKLWDDPIISKSHPEYHLGRRWDQTNTVLIDDSLEKARTEPHNLVEVPEFTGDAQEPGDVLRSVDEYLQELSMTVNVSSFIHERPFLSPSPPPMQAAVA